MELLAHKPTITETFEKVRKLSFEEKKASVLDEAKINHFLDKLLDFKKDLAEKTVKINALIDDIEQVTWLGDLNSDDLMSLNDVISSIRDLHSSLQRQYISMDPLRVKGIAKEEIKSFKLSIDDLKESAADLESRFFFLPKNPDFQETSKELSLL